MIETNLKTSDFDYYLPDELIAQTPLKDRSSSRLLVYNRETNITEHKRFSDITDYLNSGDVLVINNTKVIPARLMGHKENHSFTVEFLLLKRNNLTNWDVILRPGRKLREGDYVVFSDYLKAQICQKKEDGIVNVEFLFNGVFEEILDKLGSMPLPPYIKEKLEDKQRYNTVYAKIDGSAAAPTAGLHFTNELLDTIKEKGIIIAPILLHVGLGTFRPVKSENLSEHIMHTEFYSISESTALAVNNARKNGKKVIAVGTTSVRALESAAENGLVRPNTDNTNIFIYPGYKFQVVDSLITNFHLPKSTLIMLVSAFAGREKILDLYNTAVSEQYRFFSFGDSMFLI